MAKNYAREAGPDKHDEAVVTYRQNIDRTFTKVVSSSVRDRKTNQKFKGKTKPEEFGPYILVTSKEDADEIQTYEDINGTTAFLYFKLLEVNAACLETEDDI